MARMRQAPEEVSDLGCYEINDEMVASGDPELSDLALLSSALQAALSARRSGIIAGPGVDEVALRRALRRALRADVAGPAVVRGTGVDEWGDRCRPCQGRGLVEDLLNGELVDLTCTACRNVDGAA